MCVVLQNVPFSSPTLSWQGRHFRSPVASLSGALGFKYCDAKFSGKRFCGASSASSLNAPGNVWPFHHHLGEPPSCPQIPHGQWETSLSPWTPIDQSAFMPFGNLDQPCADWMPWAFRRSITTIVSPYVWLKKRHWVRCNNVSLGILVTPYDKRLIPIWLCGCCFFGFTLLSQVLFKYMKKIGSSFYCWRKTAELQSCWKFAV
jgi:hypothetical protein